MISLDSPLREIFEYIWSRDGQVLFNQKVVIWLGLNLHFVHADNLESKQN